jgi:hypothetical protein
MIQEAAISHKELIRRAALWLQNNQDCSVVICDRKTRVTETPDAIGFKHGCTSILVECKTTRSDFLADGKKYFRSREEYGVGDYRYFMTPPGLVKPTDEIDGWGVIECHPRQCRIIREPTFKTANKRNEVAMLTSMVRRLELAGAVFVRHETASEVEAMSTSPQKIDITSECVDDVDMKERE